MVGCFLFGGSALRVAILPSARQPCVLAEWAFACRMLLTASAWGGPPSRTSTWAWPPLLLAMQVHSGTLLTLTVLIHQQSSIVRTMWARFVQLHHGHAVRW